MLNKEMLAGLDAVVREALTLHAAEKAAGGAEDEQKWAELECRAEVEMAAIDTLINAKDAELDALDAELDAAMESEDPQKVTEAMANMFRLWTSFF